MRAWTIFIFVGLLYLTKGSPLKPFECIQDKNGNCIKNPSFSTTRPSFWPCMASNVILVEGNDAITSTIEECQQLCKNSPSCKVCILPQYCIVEVFKFGYIILNIYSIIISNMVEYFQSFQTM